MKTAGRETQKRYKNRVASRAQGTEGKNNPAQWDGPDGKKNSSQRRRIFPWLPLWNLSGASSALSLPNDDFRQRTAQL